METIRRCVVADVPALVPACSELTGNVAFAHILKPQKRAFLRLFAETGNIGKAFDTLGMHRSNHFHC
jgi:hypothetical protein